MADARIFIVAGGTGGHLYPGIAVARELRQRSPEPVEALFVVKRGDLGRSVLEKEGFSIIEIEGQGMPRRFGLNAFSFPKKLFDGFWQSRKALQQYRPSAVLGMGGYLSFPVLLNARLMGIPTLIHEQNVLPGLSNRWLARWVNSVAVSFSDSQAYFPKEKTWVSGLPIRAEIGSVTKADARKALDLSATKTTFLVFGGSQGARRLNQEMISVWKVLFADKRDFQILHITGEKEFERCRQAYEGLPVTSHVLPYCHRMADAYAAADLVICRAGASTVAELMAAGRPAILIPFPYASANHQWFNARFMKDRSLAEVIVENDLNSDSLAIFLKNYIDNPRRLQEWADRFKQNSLDEQIPSRKLADFIAGLL